MLHLSLDVGAECSLFPTLDLLPGPFPACFLFASKAQEANKGEKWTGILRQNEGE